MCKWRQCVLFIGFTIVVTVIVPVYSWTQETWIIEYRWEHFRLYLAYKPRYVYFRFGSRHIRFLLPVHRYVIHIGFVDLPFPVNVSSHWNRLAITSKNWDMSIFQVWWPSAHWILYLRLTYGSISFDGVPVLENICLAVWIVLIPYLQADICVFTIWRPPSWNY